MPTVVTSAVPQDRLRWEEPAAGERILAIESHRHSGRFILRRLGEGKDDEEELRADMHFLLQPSGWIFAKRQRRKRSGHESITIWTCGFSDSARSLTSSFKNV